jgi:plastocyanin
MRKALPLLAACGLLLFAGLSAIAAATPTLRGSVGPGDTIRVAVKPRKKGGVYRLTVQDAADDHNFHLQGPGVNVATSVGGTGAKTFRVRQPGKTYRFVCDPHADEMRGSFTVPR